MIRKSLLVSLALLSASAGLFAQEVRVPAEPQQSRYGEGKQVVNVYRSGVAAITEVVENAARFGRPVPARLTRIQQEILPQVFWGQIMEDGKMMSVSPGNMKGIWGMVLNPEHSAMKQAAATLSATELNGLDVILIRPDRMSKRWAGVFMVHEMSHMLDQRSPSSSALDCDGEFAAYVLEREFYDLITESRFTRALETAAKRFAASEEHVALSIDHPDELASVLAWIEKEMGEAPPESQAEREMRDGFYYVSLIDRIGQSNGMSMDKRCHAMIEAMKPVSKF